MSSRAVDHSIQPQVTSRGFRGACWLASLVLLACATPRAAGQASPLDFERIAPQAPPKPPSASAIPDPNDTSVVAPEDYVQVLSELRGIVLLTDPSQVVQAGWPAMEGVYAEGKGIQSDAKLVQKLMPYIGKPATFGDLGAIGKDIVRYYRARGRPVVDVQLPEQEITTGVVQFVITEGRLGGVIAEGQKWFPERRFVKAVRIKPGDEIRSNRLIDDINWLNRNPFRQSEAVFRKGEAPGETDILVRTKDRFPLRVYGGYDNSGTELTGPERLTAGFNWGNVFGLDQILSYQFSSASDLEVFTGHAGTWIIPLPWRHEIALLGSYAASKPLVDDLEVDATSTQAGMRYSIPLRGTANLRHELSLGVDWKRSNNSLLFGGQDVFGSGADVYQSRLGYQARVVDPVGVTSVAFGYVYSPGNLTNENSNEKFEESRAFATSDYMYGRADLQRLQKLPWKFSLRMLASAQLADGNLLASEQFSLGGYSTVRGYDESIANGDQGWLASVELRSPPLSILKIFKVKATDDELQFLVFYDIGSVGNVDLLPQEPSSTQLSSVGVGLRYRIGTYVTARMDYGWQLTEIDGLEGITGPGEGKFQFGVTVSY